MMANNLKHHIFDTFIVQITKVFLNPIWAKIRGHDDDGISKINRTPLSISQSTIIQNLQQNIENIRMCFLNFIQQNDWIRTTTNRFS